MGDETKEFPVTLVARTDNDVEYTIVAQVKNAEGAVVAVAEVGMVNKIPIGDVEGPPAEEDAVRAGEAPTKTGPENAGSGGAPPKTDPENAGTDPAGTAGKPE